MELDTTVQITLNDLLDQHFDLYIAANGYETRCIFLSQRINMSRINRKVALSFLEKKNEISRGFNDTVFHGLGFEFVNISMASTSEIRQVLDLSVNQLVADEMNILVDYSGMPKLWYEEIINYFIEKETGARKINIWFSYTPSEYSQAIKNVKNKYFRTTAKVNISPKPKALVIGLGYEKGRAEELAQKLKAEVTYSFYSDPAIDPRFVKELIENNKDILKTSGIGRVITYPIHDLNFINSSLTQLCVDLRLKYQIVLAPIGPKPFTLMCFLLNARYPDITIWRFSSEIPLEVYDRKPHGELLIYKVRFTSESVDYND
ncbi:MAG: hypothetical protein HC905_15490 [Bacteroidales bacterium]|nr:hypothetical protein [Bacteroidales bacterium]